MVGPSGGGKSSCVKLLQRFYDPNSGSVLLDGLPISAYKHDYLHSKVKNLILRLFSRFKKLVVVMSPTVGTSSVHNGPLHCF